MKKNTHDAHKKFLEAFFKTESVEDAITKSGLSKSKAQTYLRKYKNMYVGLFEKLGMPKDEVIKRHIALIDKPRSIEHEFKGIKTTNFDNKTQLKAIELYYKLIAALTESDVIINTNMSDVDKIKELEVAKIIGDDPALREKFMNVIESHNTDTEE